MNTGDVDQAIRATLAADLRGLGPNDAAFVQRVYRDGIDVYIRRLRACGFRDLGTVLDAGCGFGQWTLALALLNGRVTALDASETRSGFVGGLCARARATNVTIGVGRMEATGFPDEAFDAIFCYSALPWSPWREALGEFGRILRGGGTLYVNANGFGWYKHLWYSSANRTADYDPRLHVARVLGNTWRYENGQPPEPGIDVLIEPGDLREALLASGFEEIRLAAEGSLGVSGDPEATPKPFFKGKYLGDMGVYEVLARRKPCESAP